METLIPTPTVSMPVSLDSQVALHIYARERERHSFAQMKLKLGRSCAIDAERQYHGLADLELQKQEALAECNDILRSLRKGAVYQWPKGLQNFNDVEKEIRNACPVTPLDIVLGLPVFFQGDYWYAVCRDGSDAIDVCDANAACDLIDADHERPISRGNAVTRLDYDRSNLQLGFSLPEMLCVFLSNWEAGLYPELEA